MTVAAIAVMDTESNAGFYISNSVFFLVITSVIVVSFISICRELCQNDSTGSKNMTPRMHVSLGYHRYNSTSDPEIRTYADENESCRGEDVCIEIQPSHSSDEITEQSIAEDYETCEEQLIASSSQEGVGTVNDSWSHSARRVSFNSNIKIYFYPT